jgi:hypothetical protein
VLLNGWVNTPEETGSAAHFVSDDKTPLTSAFNFKHFHDRTVAALNLPQDFLVYFKSMRARFLKESSVGDRTNIGTSISPS